MTELIQKTHQNTHKKTGQKRAELIVVVYGIKERHMRNQETYCCYLYITQNGCCERNIIFIKILDFSSYREKIHSFIANSEKLF
jgi:hypothetical protein